MSPGSAAARLSIEMAEDARPRARGVSVDGTRTGQSLLPSGYEGAEWDYELEHGYRPYAALMYERAYSERTVLLSDLGFDEPDYSDEVEDWSAAGWDWAPPRASLHPQTGVFEDLCDLHGAVGPGREFETLEEVLSAASEPLEPEPARPGPKPVRRKRPGRRRPRPRPQPRPALAVEEPNYELDEPAELDGGFDPTGIRQVDDAITELVVAGWDRREIADALEAL